MSLDPKDIRPGQRYSHEEVKHLLTNKFSNRPPSTYFKGTDELDPAILSNFIKVRDALRAIDPRCIVIAYGSRTSNLYREESDYDLTVMTDQNSFARMRQLKFDFKVDLRFLHLQGIPL